MIHQMINDTSDDLWYNFCRKSKSTITALQEKKYKYWSKNIFTVKKWNLKILTNFSMKQIQIFKTWKLNKEWECVMQINYFQSNSMYMLLHCSQTVGIQMLVLCARLTVISTNFINWNLLNWCMHHILWWMQPTDCFLKEELEMGVGLSVSVDIFSSLIHTCFDACLLFWTYYSFFFTYTLPPVPLPLIYWIRGMEE